MNGIRKAWRVKETTQLQDTHPIAIGGVVYPIFTDDELQLEYRD